VSSTAWGKATLIAINAAAMMAEGGIYTPLTKDQQMRGAVILEPVPGAAQPNTKSAKESGHYRLMQNSDAESRHDDRREDGFDQRLFLGLCPR
jgi:hypothetical protein